MKTTLSRSALRRAFTLVEILIVLAIIAMLLFLTIPGLTDVLKGSKLTSTADQIITDIGIARQTAIKESVPVEVRFYKFRNPDAKNAERFAAYQCFRLRQDLNSPSDYTADRVPVPVFEKIRVIPQGVVLVDAKQWSPLIADEDMHKDRGRIRGVIPGEMDTEATYYSFVINPEGETSLDRSGAKQWYITLVTESEYQKVSDPVALKPNNFITLQVDPYTANVRRYQPN
jgi:uncharacterized protein (TIGR02596 family)